MSQRKINLNPDPDRLEVYKITHTVARYHTYRWVAEAMRFIPHDGRASQ